ncbi:acyl-CoA thioesterase [Ktedonobacter robiniae]|uniref:4-hydroxybenzoyl-CoA thioesterase n=1 Tax=Ktedonobacter robiniae TaxID=2778365 RepID=A0ABQ3V498_9CHLR|nr:acyl-CoA thioesterase [Ktedonobacter robiniae]GHO59999.1 4-hydroxybenzoyl-CoA thioesterase [Ktedonobacter robiniae]
MRTYEYHHVIGFEETNLVGNVYYVNHLRWQGRCREMFLHDLAPDVLQALENGLALVTIRCSCEYLSELFAFDHIIVRMSLGALTQSRITLQFEYWRVKGQQETLAARGEQQVACMQREGEQMRAVPVPPSLREALRQYEA